MFNDPGTILLSILLVFLCFAIPMGGTYLVIRLSGLRDKVLAEAESIRQKTRAREAKEQKGA
jgi:hypothetical protein